jgi:acyl carrier protein
VDRVEVEKMIREVVALQFDIKLDEIKPETDFVRDLNADSLDTVEIVMMVEDRFDIMIPDDDATNLLTISRVIEYVEKMLADKGSK